LERVEGMLAVVEKGTAWISNEVGMAFALRLPVYVISHSKTIIDGMLSSITSIRRCDLHEPTTVQTEIANGIRILASQIEERRKSLPEPPHQGESVELFRWERYYALIVEAYKHIIQPDISQGGYKPTIILGISRGGIIAADILARMAVDLPLALVRADRTAISDSILIRGGGLESALQEHFNRQEKLEEEVRILVVDDVIKSGNSLATTMTQVDRICRTISPPAEGGQPKWFMKLLVLICQGDPNSKRIALDYPPTCSVSEDAAVILPYGRG